MLTMELNRPRSIPFAFFYLFSKITAFHHNNGMVEVKYHHGHITDLMVHVV
jgi:hypothetical protein